MATRCPTCDDFRGQMEAIGSKLAGLTLKSGRPPKTGTPRWLRFSEALENQISINTRWLAHEREAHRETLPVIGASELPNKCGQCLHFVGVLTYERECTIELDTVLSCRAFPEGIPESIILGQRQCEPFPGDPAIELVEGR